MKNFLVISVLIILLLCLWVWSGIYLPKESALTEEVVFMAKKGQGAKEISLNLQKQGLIRWKSLFRAYVLIKGLSAELKAGKYSLSESMNIPDIVNKFVRGETIKEKITIIEGWNLGDIGQYLEKKGIAQEENFFEIAGFPAVNSQNMPNVFPWPKDFSRDYDFLLDKPKNLGLEGYLFPDTYEIGGEEEVEIIIRKILDNFGKKLEKEIREEIFRQGKTVFEVITMASLLEKEVKIKEDKEIVSGILWKRLKNNIPLQVDATITYITDRKTTKLSTEETKIESPYNTYKYKGLPLGPICNPGLESILAALYPKDSNFWYYLSTAEGETIFSKTLEEHNIAKGRYLR